MGRKVCFRLEHFLFAVAISLGGCDSTSGKNLSENNHCEANRDCADSRCHRGICVSANPGANNTPCQGDGQCKSHKCVNGKCVPGAQSTGKGCLYHEECAGGRCVGGKCVPALDGGADSSPSDASGDMIGDAAMSQGMVKTVAGGSAPDYVDDTLSKARFNHLQGLAVDDNGTIYVADTHNHRIRKISGNLVSTLAGSGGTGIYVNNTCKDGVTTSALFNQPNDVALDGSGKVYVADTFCHRIRQISGGQVTTLAGTGKSGPFQGGFKDGGISEARFYQPYALVVAPGKGIYVADAVNNRIRLVSGKNVSTVAGSGTAGHLDGLALQAQVNHPEYMTLSASGQLYFSDCWNHLVRRLDTTQAKVSFVAGSGKPGHNGGGFANGGAASAKFKFPAGMNFDSKGRLIIVDRDNHLIRIYHKGLVSTLAGGGKPGANNGSFKDGPALQARFNQPSGLDIDKQGRIFVADTQNNRVRVILPSGTSWP